MTALNDRYPPTPVGTAWVSLLFYIIGKSLGRLPFITRKGHLVMSSELVAIIKGVQVAFILRRRISGVYQLISEAYVDGVMDGEAAEETKFATMELV